MADGIKLVVHSHTNGRDVQNTFYYTPDTGTPGPGDTTNLAVWFRDNVLPAWKNASSVETTFDMVEASAVGAFDAPVDQIILVEEKGAIGGEAMPDNCVLRIQRISVDGVPGVQKGFVQISGLPESGVTDNAINGGYQSGVLATFVTALSQTAIGISGSVDYAPAVQYTPRGEYIREEGVTVSAGADTTFTFTTADPAAAGFLEVQKTTVRGDNRVTGTYFATAVTANSITLQGDIGFQGVISAELEFNQINDPTLLAIDQWAAGNAVRTLRRRTTKYESSSTAV